MEQERFERVDLGGAFGHRVEIRERKGEVSIVFLDDYSTGLAMVVSVLKAKDIAEAILKVVAKRLFAPPPIPAQMGGNPVLARLDPTSLVAIATVVRDAMDERTFDLTAGLVASVLEECGYERVNLHTVLGRNDANYSPREFGSQLVEEIARRVALEKAQERDGD